MATFQERIIGAARLDVKTFEEIEADTTAMGQALGVVVLSSVAAGIATRSLTGLVFGSIIAVVGWAIWALLVFVIGTKMLPEPQTKADLPEVLRVTGFAIAPGIIRVVGIIPGLATVVGVVAAVWMLVAMVVAVRQTFDYASTGRAVLVCVIGWVAYVVIIAILAAPFAMAALS